MANKNYQRVHYTATKRGATTIDGFGASELRMNMIEAGIEGVPCARTINGAKAKGGTICGYKIRTTNRALDKKRVHLTAFINQWIDQGNALKDLNPEGMSEATVRRIVNGQVTMNLANYKALCAFFIPMGFKPYTFEFAPQPAS